MIGWGGEEALPAAPERVPAAEAARTVRIREAMARAMCELAGSDPDFRMWDGQPLWKWRMHGREAQARIQAAIDALSARS